MKILSVIPWHLREQLDISPAARSLRDRRLHTGGLW